MLKLPLIKGKGLQYDAKSKRIKKIGWKPEIVLNLCNELGKSLKPSSVINTVIGNVPLGSYLGYQLFDRENPKLFLM